MCTSETSSRCSEDSRAGLRTGTVVRRCGDRPGPHVGSLAISVAPLRRAFRRPTRRRRLFAVSRGPRVVLSPAWATRAWVGRSDRLVPTPWFRGARRCPAWWGGALDSADPLTFGETEASRGPIPQLPFVALLPGVASHVGIHLTWRRCEPPGVPGGAPPPIAAYRRLPGSAHVRAESLA